MVELVTRGKRTDVATEIVEVRNCGVPGRKTTSCSAGTSRDLSVTLEGGAQFGEGLVGSINAGVTTGLGIGHDSGESLELESPPSGSIYRYTVDKTYRVLAGKILVRSSSGREQEAEYAFHASCSISVQDIPETLNCENGALPPQPPETVERPPTSLAEKILDAKGVEMVLIPAGEFLMGSTDSDVLAESDERPPHHVYLDDFYIDIYEVTNMLYAACVKSGWCTSPRRSDSPTRNRYYGSPEYDNYPVIYVDWNQASAYCAWRGASLPTEAEWEKAARGTDGRVYPWGNNAPTCELVNYHRCVGDTQAVGSYPAGANGLFDMAGNAWEWIQDWYSETYYTSSLERNPTGPDSGKYHMLRGGSWFHDNALVRSAYRDWYNPRVEYVSIGFRCARTP